MSVSNGKSIPNLREASRSAAGGLLASLIAKRIDESTIKKIPASQLFDVINEQLSENPEEVKDAIKKGNGIFAFTIRGNSGVTDSWHVDLKSTGRVGKGIGEKPNVTFVLDEDNFTKLFLGEANAQNLFMTGKLKIKGNIMKALALQPVLQVVRVKAKL